MEKRLYGLGIKGKMAEWSKATVCYTGVLFVRVGSNPTLLEQNISYLL